MPHAERTNFAARGRRGPIFDHAPERRPLSRGALPCWGSRRRPSARLPPPRVGHRVRSAGRGSASRRYLGRGDGRPVPLRRPEPALFPIPELLLVSRRGGRGRLERHSGADRWHRGRGPHRGRRRSLPVHPDGSVALGSRRSRDGRGRVQDRAAIFWARGRARGRVVPGRFTAPYP